MQNPGGVIFLNSDTPEQPLSVVQRQLFIDETIDLNEFNSRISNDQDYSSKIRTAGTRILVLIDYSSIVNRDLADVVIYVKFGLAYVQKNNFGPPGLSIPVDRMYLQKLTQNV